jgi:hypothetical protein
MDQRRAVEAYFRAFRERDKEGLRSLLTADFHHVSPFGEWRDRDAMIEAIWPQVGRSWAAGLQVFGAAPEWMVRYQVEGADGPAANMAEFVRFEGDRIAEIEVYAGRQLPGPSGEPRG